MPLPHEALTIHEMGRIGTNRRTERLHVSNILVVHLHYPSPQLLEPAPDPTPFCQISQRST